MSRALPKIEVGKADPGGYNSATQVMIRADKSMYLNKGLAADGRVWKVAVICALFAGLAIAIKPGSALPSYAQADALQSWISRLMSQRATASVFPVSSVLEKDSTPRSLGSSAPSALELEEYAQRVDSVPVTELPRCVAESAFFKNLPKGFHWPNPGDELSLRVLKEYGALFVARGGVALPPAVIFRDPDAVARWQSNLSTEQAELGGILVRLQAVAMRALMKAREEAFQAHINISPRSSDAAQRSYSETLELWRSRVNPGLRHWVAKGLLSSTEAKRIRGLPAREQVPEILGLEKRGLYFSRNFSKSILSSAAPPGASQHLSLLAFDVKEHENPVVRSILERHGWFQTARSDLPHFTYLGATKQQLPSLGLKMIRSGNRVFWAPDFDCPAPTRP